MTSPLTAAELREKLLGHGVTRRYADVDVPGMGVVRIRSLTERERAVIEKQAATGDISYRALLISMAVVEQNGFRIFTDAEAEELCNSDCRLTMTLSDAILEHVGGLSVTAKLVEDAIKN